MANSAQTVPLTLQLHWAAEWAPHRAIYIAYPHDATLWGADLQAAQQECLALCRALSPGDSVRLLVANEALLSALQAELAGTTVVPQVLAYGDIWLRDTAPIFVHDAAGHCIAGCFVFNGWGNKYTFADDRHLNLRLANGCAAAGEASVRLFDFVLEGGSVETDGAGCVLTSRQCLLNKNRNAHMDERSVEAALRHGLGAQKVIWLDAGLHNDHTDGHIDTLARFVGLGEVVCMVPSGPQDPNAAQLAAIEAVLCAATDAAGNKLVVHRIVSPGAVTNGAGELLPASYLNFIIGNDTVVVPTYGTPHCAAAVAQLAKLFVGRETLGLPATAILSGGGAFHCMSQQLPT
jgi:agmatine deiminase